MTYSKNGGMRQIVTRFAKAFPVGSNLHPDTNHDREVVLLSD